MRIETKFDMGQEVFYLNRASESVEKRIVIAIKSEVWKYDGELQTTTIYRLDNHTWTSESRLFADERIASEELLKYQKYDR